MRRLTVLVSLLVALVTTGPMAHSARRPRQSREPPLPLARIFGTYFPTGRMGSTLR
jgi:hypothetical protein